MKYETFEIGEIASQLRGLSKDKWSAGRDLADCLSVEELSKAAQMLEDFEDLLYSTGKVKVKVHNDVGK